VFDEQVPVDGKFKVGQGDAVLHVDVGKSR
jgi:hypothetical protein